jgi:hypothetical protein
MGATQSSRADVEKTGLEVASNFANAWDLLSDDEQRAVRSIDTSKFFEKKPEGVEEMARTSPVGIIARITRAHNTDRGAFKREYELGYEVFKIGRRDIALIEEIDVAHLNDWFAVFVAAVNIHRVQIVVRERFDNTQLTRALTQLFYLGQDNRTGLNVVTIVANTLPLIDSVINKSITDAVEGAAGLEAIREAAHEFDSKTTNTYYGEIIYYAAEMRHDWLHVNRWKTRITQEEGVTTWRIRYTSFSRRSILNYVDD